MSCGFPAPSSLQMAAAGVARSEILVNSLVNGRCEESTGDSRSRGAYAEVPPPNALTRPRSRRPVHGGHAPQSRRCRRWTVDPGSAIATTSASVAVRVVTRARSPRIEKHIAARYRIGSRRVGRCTPSDMCGSRRIGAPARRATGTLLLLDAGGSRPGRRRRQRGFRASQAHDSRRRRAHDEARGHGAEAQVQVMQINGAHQAAHKVPPPRPARRPSGRRAHRDGGGLKDCGPVVVLFTKTAATSPASTLAVDR